MFVSAHIGYLTCIFFARFRADLKSPHSVRLAYALVAAFCASLVLSPFLALLLLHVGPFYSHLSGLSCNSPGFLLTSLFFSHLVGLFGAAPRWLSIEEIHPRAPVRSTSLESDERVVMVEPVIDEPNIAFWIEAEVTLRPRGHKFHLKQFYETWGHRR